MSLRPQHKHDMNFYFVLRRGIRDFIATLFRISNEKLQTGIFYIMHPSLAIKTRNNIVLIYTMGKTASNSVYYAVKSKLPNIKCFAMHYMADESLEAQEKLLEDSIYKEMHTKHARKIDRYIKKYPRKKVKIITLVRQPLHRDLSHIFQYKSVYETKTSDGVELDLSNYDFSYAINWFEKEFMEFTGIDVFEHPFDKKRGYTIIRNEKTEILLLRFEDLEKTFGMAMHQFFKVNKWKLPNKNNSEKKYYSEEYKRFKSDFKLKPEKLESLLKSKYARHFYSNDQLQKLKERFSLHSDHSRQ